MIYTSEALQSQWPGISNFAAHAKVEIDRGRLFRLRRGLYTDDPNEDPFLVANAIYAPSYVSFSTALSLYGLIPERVVECQSAVTSPGRAKRFENALGRFSYLPVPGAAFPYGTCRMGQAQVATPEKALADALWLRRPVHSLKEFKGLLFEDLRIDEEGFAALSREDLLFILPRYRSTNANWLIKLLEEEGNGKQD
jgi:hypothetical protein